MSGSSARASESGLQRPESTDTGRSAGGSGAGGGVALPRTSDLQRADVPFPPHLPSGRVFKVSPARTLSRRHPMYGHCIRSGFFRVRIGTSGRPKTVTRALNRPIPDVLQGQGLVGRPVWSLSRGCPTFSGRPSGRPRICRRAYSSNFPQPEPCPGGGSMYGHCIAVAFFVPGPGRPDVRKRPPWS